jgi:plastocyanin
LFPLRKLLVLALVGAVFAILATQAFAASRSVKVGDNYFVRPSGVPTITVKKGTTVTWRFDGSNLHTVVVRSGPAKFRSSAKSSGTYKRKLTRSGTYRIYCSIHGAADQSMKLVVR